jgi:hypothetical protein
LLYRDVIAAKKGTYEPVPNNLVTANWIARGRTILLVHGLASWVLCLPLAVQYEDKQKNLARQSRTRWDRLHTPFSVVWTWAGDRKSTASVPLFPGLCTTWIGAPFFQTWK